MDSFMDICIQDGGLTDAGERACSLVYERITGNCWHVEGEWRNDTFHCAKCKCSLRHDFKNRQLATSLDAWMPLWEAMDNELMAELFGMRVTNRHLLDPMWWLEASLRACGLYEKWRADSEQG